jgi:hypothetical protein
MGYFSFSVNNDRLTVAEREKHASVLLTARFAAGAELSDTDLHGLLSDFYP